jgi:D-alanyl-D-alanine-carboxypeptidase/D-alanyl-D-alanine-endopeptidase
MTSVEEFRSRGRAGLRRCGGVTSAVRRVGGALLFVALAATGAARGQGIQVPDDVRANVRARVDNGWSVGIVIGVVDSTGSRYFSYGSTARTGGRPVDERTVFEIGSVTKAFTALALADMVVHGEVGLDDPVQRYLPDSVHVPSLDGKEITLRLLSAQRSGLPRMPNNFAPADPNNPFADYGVDRLYAFLNGYTLTRDPGASYEYSNVGVGLLGLALARRAGTNYENLVLQRVIRPLHMRDTRIKLTPELRARLARGHAGGREVGNWDLNDAVAGAGALRSTAQDMVQLVAAAAGLTHTPLDSAFRVTETIQFDAGRTLRIGLGWHVVGSDTAMAFWHNGQTGGYHAIAGFDLRRRIGVVVLSNDASNIDDIGFHILNPARALMAPRVAIALPADSLDAYLGTYQLAPTFAITVRKEGESLMAHATGQGALPIFPSARDVFFYKVVDAQISFVRDSTGKVTSLILHQAGRNMPAPKQP